ncbi:hypothetical protein ACWFR5_14295 [Streptomyces sp. NPDC055092]
MEPDIRLRTMTDAIHDSGQVELLAEQLDLRILADAGNHARGR